MFQPKTTEDKDPVEDKKILYGLTNNYFDNTVLLFKESFRESSAFDAVLHRIIPHETGHCCTLAHYNQNHYLMNKLPLTKGGDKFSATSIYSLRNMPRPKTNSKN